MRPDPFVQQAVVAPFFSVLLDSANVGEYKRGRRLLFQNILLIGAYFIAAPAPRQCKTFDL
jgi:hypothetical protein